MDKLRRVFVKSNKNDKIQKTGFFHGFFQWTEDNDCSAQAVIELDDGKCDYYPVDWIYFIKNKKDIKNGK